MVRVLEAAHPWPSTWIGRRHENDLRWTRILADSPDLNRHDEGITIVSKRPVPVNVRVPVPKLRNRGQSRMMMDRDEVR